MKSKNPECIDGDMVVDDRGVVKFVNGFNFKGVKRFYQVSNHRRGFIRAWHGHRKEGKYVYVAKGSALVGAVDFDSSLVNKYILSAQRPRVLWIPPGYYNGFKTLEEDTIVQFFSTSTLEDSKNDDVRIPYDEFNIWEEDFR